MAGSCIALLASMRIEAKIGINALTLSSLLRRQEFFAGHCLYKEVMMWDVAHCWKSKTDALNIAGFCFPPVVGRRAADTEHAVNIVARFFLLSFS
jgi:hypothetical protein